MILEHKRKKESMYLQFQHTLSSVSPPIGATSQTAVTSTIVNRTQPKFSKYDGKCDHLAVNQFIHQFNAYFPLVKPTNPHDKVHVAASHLTGEVVTWWQHWSMDSNRTVHPCLSFQVRLSLQHSSQGYLSRLRWINSFVDWILTFTVRNFESNSYDWVLTLAQNEEMKMNGGKPKQPQSSTKLQQQQQSASQLGKGNSCSKDAKKDESSCSS